MDIVEIDTSKKFFLQRKGSKSRFEPYELKMRTRTAHGEANIEGIYNFAIPVTGLYGG